MVTGLTSTAFDDDQLHPPLVLKALDLPQLKHCLDLEDGGAGDYRGVRHKAAHLIHPGEDLVEVELEAGDQGRPRDEAPVAVGGHLAPDLVQDVGADGGVVDTGPGEAPPAVLDQGQSAAVAYGVNVDPEDDRDQHREGAAPSPRGRGLSP